MANPVAPRLLAAVGAGGALGTLLRVGIGELVSTSAAATLTVNLVGAALLGLLAGWNPFINGAARSPILHPFFTTGLLGGFTTYSALALEVATLPGWTAAGYAILTVVSGVGLAAGGILLGRRVRGRERDGA